VVIAGTLWISSPGKPRPFLDQTGHIVAGSISEKTHVDINGVEQGMFIKGKVDIALGESHCSAVGEPLFRRRVSRRTGVR
jgi:hypothetical protein